MLEILGKNCRTKFCGICVYGISSAFVARLSRWCANAYMCRKVRAQTWIFLPTSVGLDRSHRTTLSLESYPPTNLTLHNETIPVIAPCYNVVCAGSEWFRVEVGVCDTTIEQGCQRVISFSLSMQCRLVLPSHKE